MNKKTLTQIDYYRIRDEIAEYCVSQEGKKNILEREPFIGKCKFGMNCKHDSEPGCAIHQALEEQKITEQRYDSWKRISNEIRTGSWCD